jgi:hypothetical protein
MAKTKCVLCKLTNAINESKKHFNTTTAMTVMQLNNMIALKDHPLHSKAISTFCDVHRNPLQLNMTISWCSTEINKLKQYGEMARFVK